MSVGCMYVAKMNDSMKKDVKAQRRRGEIKLSMQLERDVNNSKGNCVIELLC